MNPLTDGGPSLAADLPTGAPGPPFGDAPGLAFATSTWPNRPITGNPSTSVPRGCLPNAKRSHAGPTAFGSPQDEPPALAAAPR